MRTRLRLEFVMIILILHSVSALPSGTPDYLMESVGVQGYITKQRKDLPR